MTKEELQKAIDQCIENSCFYEDLDEYYWGKAEGMLEVYEEWLQKLIQEEKKGIGTMKVVREDVPELIGQFIDLFEDFLDEKGIVIPNEERDENIELDAENSANIYGSDYDILPNGIEEILTRWKLIKAE